MVSVLLTLSVKGDYSREHTAAEEEEHQGITAGLAVHLARPAAPRHGDRLDRVPAGGRAWGWWPTRRSPSTSARARRVRPADRLLGTGVGRRAACSAASSRRGPSRCGWSSERWGSPSPAWASRSRRRSRSCSFALLVMGMSDGISIVAEQGIMMRRSPDAVRSRVMAGFDALLSLGIAVAYVFAGPVLELARAQGGLRRRRCLGGDRRGAAAARVAAAAPRSGASGASRGSSRRPTSPERPVRELRLPGRSVRAAARTGRHPCLERRFRRSVDTISDLQPVRRDRDRRRPQRAGRRGVPREGRRADAWCSRPGTRRAAPRDTMAPWPEAPEFKVTTLSYVMSLMPDTILRDLAAGAARLPACTRPARTSCRSPTGAASSSTTTPRRTTTSSPSSRSTTPTRSSAWDAWIGGLAEVLGPLLMTTPPDGRIEAARGPLRSAPAGVAVPRAGREDGRRRHAADDDVASSTSSIGSSSRTR